MEEGTDPHRQPPQPGAAGPHVGRAEQTCTRGARLEGELANCSFSKITP